MKGIKVWLFNPECNEISDFINEISIIDLIYNVHVPYFKDDAITKVFPVLYQV